MDCFICDFCHFGAAAAFVNCVACGPVKIHKCTTCAPRYDRSIQITTMTCKQCEMPLSICNQPHNQACQRAKQPCKECHGVFHTHCPISDSGYLTNQCTWCGTVDCPTCDLTPCSGGCQGNWVSLLCE
ncbi:hypothetical protein BX666DRAFT_1931402 [Dichotomocladium elegans]|nr:hypothetical protein BX666DRAFT_1931402 [Dichotomocladium elegans]